MPCALSSQEQCLVVKFDLNCCKGFVAQFRQKAKLFQNKKPEH